MIKPNELIAFMCGIGIAIWIVQVKRKSIKAICVLSVNRSFIAVWFVRSISNKDAIPQLIVLFDILNINSIITA
jgi:hypothetical protein